jgi:hypothetical protein
MRQLGIRAFALVVPVTALGCNPYQCIYETRFVSTAPVSTPTAAGTFSGWVNMRDYSEGQPIPVSIAWNLQIAGSTVTSLTLRDQRDMSKVLATIGVSQSGVAASGTPPLQTKAEKDAAFDTLGSGNGVLVAETTASSSPVLVPLTVATRDDWHRGICS